MTVDVSLDFVSPYPYLAWRRARVEARPFGVRRKETQPAAPSVTPTLRPVR